MNQEQPGLFIFYDWLEVLDRLHPKAAMTVIRNVLRYHRDGTVPEPLPGRAGFVQDAILTDLRRTQKAKLYARMGAEAKRVHEMDKAGVYLREVEEP